MMAPVRLFLKEGANVRRMDEHTFVLNGLAQSYPVVTLAAAAVAEIFLSPVVYLQLSYIFARLPC